MWAGSRHPPDPLFQAFIIFLFNNYNTSLSVLPLSNLAPLQSTFHIARNIILLRHVFHTPFLCLNIFNNFQKQTQPPRCDTKGSFRTDFCLCHWCSRLRYRALRYWPLTNAQPLLNLCAFCSGQSSCPTHCAHLTVISTVRSLHSPATVLARASQH